MPTNIRGKLVYSPSFVALAFRNGLEYHNVDGRIDNGDELATLFLKFGELRSSNSGVYDGRRSTPLVDQQWS